MKKSLLTIAMVVGLFVVASAQQRQQRSPEERAKMTSEMMSKQLSLTEDQKKQVYDANLARWKAMSDLRDKAGEGKRPDMAEMKKIQDAYDASINKTLTAEQKEKFEEAKKNMRNRGSSQTGNRRQGQDGQAQDKSGE